MGREEILAQIIVLAEQANDAVTREYLMAEAESIMSQMDDVVFSFDFLFQLGERVEYELTNVIE